MIRFTAFCSYLVPPSHLPILIDQEMGSGPCTIFSMMPVWGSEVTTMFLTLETEQVNNCAQNPREIEFSVSTEVCKMLRFQHFLIESWDTV